MSAVPTQRHPLLPALAAQFCGLLGIGLPTVMLFPELLEHGFLLALLQGGIAATISRWLGAPNWWLVIHLAFLPLVVLARMLELPASLWAGGFILLILVFWRTDRSRVPLFLSSREATEVLLALLPKAPCRVIDLGCGDGALLRHLARRRPESRFVGIEHAPLPWLWARIAAASLPNLAIRYGDFWRHSLADYDLVYAFLSPTPMPRLWAKARSELREGARLVSNSFAVPDCIEDQRIELGDQGMTYFYVYRPPRAAV